MIEKQLDELIDINKRILTALITPTNVVPFAAPKDQADPVPAKKTKPEAALPPAAPPPPPVKEETKPVAEEPDPMEDDDLTGEEEVEEEKKITQADVVNKVRKAVAAFGREPVRAILAKVGADRAAAVPEKEYKKVCDLIAALKN